MRLRIALPKITGTEELTAGQLPSRKSLGSSSSRDRSPLPPPPSVNSFVISSVELVPRAHGENYEAYT